MTNIANRMKFSHDMQWVSIDRLRALMGADQPMHAECDVATLAEEALRGLQQPTNELIGLIREFDGHF